VAGAVVNVPYIDFIYSLLTNEKLYVAPIAVLEKSIAERTPASGINRKAGAQTRLKNKCMVIPL